MPALKTALLEAWAEDKPLTPVVSAVFKWKEVTQEYPHFTPSELRFLERKLIADGVLGEGELTPLPEGEEELTKGTPSTAAQRA